MIYKDFKDKKLSALGMGCMRFPHIGETDEIIDEEKTKEIIDYAMANGINYYDTAWAYHWGNSETIMGKLLKNYPRDNFYLATKFPGYAKSYFGKVEEIFEKQLEKCQVEYFDFYLFHNLCEMNVDAYLDEEKYGIFPYLMKQKANGRIKHLGFSTHGTLETMKRFLEAYGEHMEFCQIQLNYLDWDLQNAKAKVDLLNEYNIPIWVMEPVRGGKLASLDEAHSQKLLALRPDEKIVNWAFRFLQTIPGVTMVLSGMSNLEQLSENIKTYETEKPLSDKEWDALIEIADEMIGKNTLPCTACHYCTSYCPKELNIPWLIELYNEHTFTGGGFIAPMALSSLDDEKKPAACISCKACEAVCPQQIKISEMMSDFAEKMKKK